MIRSSQGDLRARSGVYGLCPFRMEDQDIENACSCECAKGLVQWAGLKDSRVDSLR